MCGKFKALARPGRSKNLTSKLPAIVPLQLYELLTGDSLFDPSFQTMELGLAPEESHLIQIIEMVGELPLDLIKSGKHAKKWFNDDGTLRPVTSF